MTRDFLRGIDDHQAYRRRRGWTRERDRRIQELVERAKAGLPLFE